MLRIQSIGWRSSITRSRTLSMLQAKLSSEICLAGFIAGASSLLLSPTLLNFWLCSAFLLITIILTRYCRLFLPLVFFWVGLLVANTAFTTHRDTVFPDHLERQSVQLIGDVIDLPIVNKQDHKFRFRIRAAPEELALSHLRDQLIQLSCYQCDLRFNPGERWQLTVRLKRPHGYASWGAFDYEKYLFRHRIVAKGYIRLNETNALVRSGNAPVERLRQSIRQQIIKGTNGDPGAAIIRALSIGDKSGLSHEQKLVLQKTGVSHLMAISGMHVGLVFIFAALLGHAVLWPASRLYQRVPRQHLVLIPALCAALAYSALAGFAVSTQRALVMLTVYSVCRLSAKDVSLNKVLLIAMSLLLLVDPFSILDTGFWLSCSAVFIIAETNRVAQRVTLIRLQPVLWLGMMPLTILFFGQVSLVSPLVNLIAVPVFCLVLIPATLAAILLLISGLHSLAWWLIDVLRPIYNIVFEGLDVIARQPFASVMMPEIAVWQWLCIIAWVAVHRVKRRLSLWCLPLLIGLLLFQPSSKLAEDALRIALLDVGQGLSMVIETHDSVTVYDTGPKYSSGFNTADAVLLPYLRTRGIKKIDRLIISHADNDHIGGLERLIASLPVDKILTSRTDRVADSELCQKGQFWFEGRTRFSILSPDARTPSGSNNQSCVLMLEHAGTRVLLSGDIEKPVERHLLGTENTSALRADIMLVPHQGSKTSSTPAFIESVAPELALVAAGYRNHYRHPHPEVIARYADRGIPVLSTIDAGSILLHITPTGWRASTFRMAKQRFWHYQKVSNTRG